MSKKIVVRGGQRILGTLASGTGDPILTRDAITSDLGTVPPIDPSTYLTTTLTSAYIIVGNSSNLATPVPLIGAVSITNTGLSSISTNIITDANIFTGAGIQYSKLSLNNSIVNNDISSTANISRSKLISGTPYRLVINNLSGVVSEANTITPGRVLVSDVNGIPTDSGVTSTVLGRLDVTSSTQTQLDNRLPFSSAVIPAEGDLVVYQSGVWNRFARGTSGQYLTSTISGLSWISVPNGVPIGGSAGQFLNKINSTDFNTQWSTLTLSLVTDVTATFTQVNALATGYYDATSSIQTQFSSKLNNSLANNAIFVGNASNVPAQLSPGSNGQVLTIVAGVPQWQTVTGTGTVTSVAFSGGSTGLTVTGSPITTSGTITLTGTLGTANGGTNLTSYTTGDLIYASSSSVLSKLGVGTNGYVLTVSGGLPTWQVNVASSPLTTKGDIYVYSVTNTRLPVGTNGFQLVADSTQTTGLKWIAQVSNPFSDISPLIKNDVDNTKLANFSAASITTATTRTYTLPDSDGTIALLGAANGVALSRVNDTNVTLTLGGSPNTALLASTSLTLSWAGTLAYARFTDGAGLSIVGRGTNSTGVQADITAGSDFQILRRNGTSVAFGSIDLSQPNTVGSSTLSPVNGGTGVANNVASTITVSGSFATTLTISGVTTLTLPTSGTLSTLTGAESLTNKKLGSLTTNGFVKTSGSDGTLSVDTNTYITTGSAWLLASGGVLTGTNNVTANANGRLIFDGTWTASAANQFATSFGSTITGDSTASHVTIGNKLAHSFTQGANTQDFVALYVASTFASGGFTLGRSISALFGDSVAIGKTTLNGNTRFEVQGLGTSSSTVNQRWLNSAAISLMILNDDGTISQAYSGTASLARTNIGFNAGTMSMTSGSNSIIGVLSSATLNTTTTYSGGSISMFSASLTTTATVGLSVRILDASIGGLINNSSAASSNYYGAYLRPTFNLTGSAVGGVSYGIYYDPTRTSVNGLTEYAFACSSGLSGFGTLTPNVTVDNTGGEAWRQTTKAQITANQNDYAIGSQSSFRMSSDASRNITGFTGGVDGKILIIRNVGAQNIVFTHEDTNSVAANRITCSTAANITIAANGVIMLQYDSTASRWFDISVR